MTIAKEILEQAKNENEDVRLINCEAYDMAEQKYTDVDQDWDNEATIYTFEDGSKLRLSENKVELL